MINRHISNTTFSACVSAMEFGPRLFDKRNPNRLRFNVGWLCVDQALATRGEVIINNDRSSDAVHIELKQVNAGRIDFFGDENFLDHFKLATLNHSRHNCKQVTITNASLSHSAVIREESGFSVNLSGTSKHDAFIFESALLLIVDRVKERLFVWGKFWISPRLSSRYLFGYKLLSGFHSCSIA